MTTDKVKEIVNDVFDVYYSEYMGQGEYNVNEAQEALDTVLDALDLVDKYKKAIEEIKAEIDENIQECQSPLVHDLRWTGRFQAFIESLEIINKHLKGVKS